MKNPNIVLKEYINRVSDEELRFLNSRFQQRLQGDEADVLHVCGRSNDLDRLLKEQSSYEDFYYALDTLESLVKKESEKRSAKKTR